LKKAETFDASLSHKRLPLKRAVGGSTIKKKVGQIIIHDHTGNTPDDMKLVSDLPYRTEVTFRTHTDTMTNFDSGIEEPNGRNRHRILMKVPLVGEMS